MVIQIKRSIGQVCPGSEEPSGGRGEWPVILARESPGRADADIGTPFRPESAYIQSRDARVRRKQDVVVLRTIDHNAEIQKGRRILFFTCANGQSRFTAPFLHNIGEGGETPGS